LVPDTLRSRAVELGQSFPGVPGAAPTKLHGEHVLQEGRAAARPLSRRPAGAGQFRTCLAGLMVTDIGDDARWNVSAAEVGTVLGIPHRAGLTGSGLPAGGVSTHWLGIRPGSTATSISPSMSPRWRSITCCRRSAGMVTGWRRTGDRVALHSLRAAHARSMFIPTPRAPCSGLRKIWWVQLLGRASRES